MYAIFIRKSSGNLQSYIKECIIAYLSSKYFLSYPGSKYGKQKPFRSYRMAILCSSNYFMAVIESHLQPPVLNIDLSKHEISSKMNGLLLTDGIRGMIDGKEYYSMDMDLPFVPEFTERCTGFRNWLY